MPTAQGAGSMWEAWEAWVAKARSLTPRCPLPRLLLALALLALTAWDTVDGAGRDMERLGRGYSDGFEGLVLFV